MDDAFFLQPVIGNVLVSAALAALAFALHRLGRRPAIAHLVGIGALLALLTPPLFHVRLLPNPGGDTPSAVGAMGEGAPPNAAAPGAPSQDGGASAPGIASDLADDGVGPSPAAWWLGAWLLGSAAVLLLSIRRLTDFRRALRSASRPAPAAILQATDVLSVDLGLRRAPRVVVTPARVSPFVWWFGRRVEVVLPSGLVDATPERDLRLLLAHELAHVARRDHCVRWIELAATVAFWWNPVVWWTRRHLRASEELACDALVLGALRPGRRTYAAALLRAAESLAGAAVRPPAIASAMHSGGSLEGRMTMILTHSFRRTSRLARGLVLAVLAAALPLGIAHAKDFEAVERRLGRAVESGEITLEQAQVMMVALRRSAASEPRDARPGEHERCARDRAEGARESELHDRGDVIQRRARAAVERGDSAPDSARRDLMELHRPLSDEAPAERNEPITTFLQTVFIGF